MNFQMIQNILVFEDKATPSLIGRTREINKLENFFQEDQPVILVQGQTGMGKTALVREFIKNLTVNNSESHSIFWFSFPNLRTIELMFNSIAVHASINHFFNLSLHKKIETMSYILGMKSHTIIIDNFEKASGTMSDHLSPILHSDELDLLRELFGSMNGKTSKFILLTAETDDEFHYEIDSTIFSQIKIGPLDQTSTEELAKKILQPYDIHIDFKQREINHLMKIINGHPMSIKTLLPRLQYQTPEMLISSYHSHRHFVMRIGGTRSSEYRTHLMALIDMVVSDLPSMATQILPAMGMYEGSIELDLFLSVVSIYQTAVKGSSSEKLIEKSIKEIISFFEHNDLLARYIPGTENYQIIPILTEYLRRITLASEQQNIHDDWAGAFIHVVARLASNLKSLDSFGKQIWYHFNNATFHQAYEEAQKHHMHDHSGVLLHIIATFARINRNYAKAERCFTELVGIHRALEDPQMQGITMFQLAHIAEEQKQYDKARIWLQRALKIFEKADREYEAASVRHQLGRVSHRTGDLDIARRWLKQALKTFSRGGESFEAADIARQLGSIGYEQNDLDKAEKWYERAMDIFEVFGDEFRAATIYQELGIIATDKRNYDISDHWLKKAMKIFEKLGMTQNLVTIYQKSAQNAQVQGDTDTAELYYVKSFSLMGNSEPKVAAQMYKSLGKMSQDRFEYERAGRYYQMARAIFERLNDDVNPQYAELLFDMSILEGLKGNFERSGKYLVQSIQLLDKEKSKEEIQFRVNNFKLSYLQASDDAKKRLREYWEEYMGSFPM